MHSKIYTRYRFRIPKKKTNVRFDNGKNAKILKIIVILIIAILTLKFTLDAVTPIFDTLCEDEAKSIATIISNEKATEVMSRYSYAELYSVEKDNQGNITMIKTNIIPINEIISDIALKIQEEINAKGRDNISIALGSFTGIKLLAGKGPGVKITISSIGNVETDLKSEFTAKGINQTLHRVYLQVKCQISILTPFDNITREITNQVLLAENVIVGNIPSTYYNLEGLEDSKSTLEVIK
jgi:sporulation protein YunB